MQKDPFGPYSDKFISGFLFFHCSSFR